MNKTTLPQLDLSAFHAGGAQRAAFLHELKTAAREVGFFYLKGHGVPDSLQQQVLDVSRQFFALPDAAKQRVAMVNSPHFRGYTRAGGELTLGQADWREQFDVMRETPRFLRELESKAAGKDAVIVLLCRSGKRSAAAAEAASRAGFSRVFNVLEGFEGDLDEQHRRGDVGGWRHHRLPWQQD